MKRNRLNAFRSHIHPSTIVSAALLTLLLNAQYAIASSSTDETCPSVSDEWKKRYEAVAMERAPSMFDKCNPFSDIFVSDFWGDLLDKIGIPNFELCGYGTNDLFEDATGTTTNTIRKSASSAIEGEISDTINKVVKPVTGKSSTGSIITNGSSNDAIKDVIFN